jgi:hypothetical protein
LQWHYRSVVISGAPTRRFEPEQAEFPGIEHVDNEGTARPQFPAVTEHLAERLQREVARGCVAFEGVGVSCWSTGAAESEIIVKHRSPAQVSVGRADITVNATNVGINYSTDVMVQNRRPVIRLVGD